ncbi:MAG: oligosaccharide flippase family protein [Sphingomonas sp.]
MSHGSIVTRITRSARWAFVESLLSATASLGTVLVLARFVGPAEFGRAGIAVAISAIIQTILLGGMPDAIVRAPSAHTRLTDSVFWSVLALGACGAAVIAAIGLATGSWWQDPRLGALIAVQGLTTLAVAAAAVPTGLLLRKMRTRALVNRTAMAKLAGLAASVGFAFAGYGAWAVVFGNLFSQGFGLLQLLTSMRRPRWRVDDPALAQTLQLGVLAGAQQTLGTLATRGFVLAFGIAYGAHAVGLFNFALRLVEESCGLVITTLRRVTVTSFAAAKRSGVDMKPLFVRGTNVIAYATAPLFLGGAAVAHDAVELLFGPQWLGAVPALQLMLCMWVLRSTRMLVNAIMVVDGRQRALVGFGLIGLAATAIAFFVSLPFGERWTTLSYAATLFGVVFGGTAFARQSGIGFGTQVRAGLTPILLAVTMWGAVTVLRTGPLAGLPPALRLGTEVVAGLGIFLALAMIVDRPGLARLQRLALRR